MSAPSPSLSNSGFEFSQLFPFSCLVLCTAWRSLAPFPPVALALPSVLGPCPSLSLRVPQVWHSSLLHSRCTPFASLLPGCRQPGHGQHRKDGLALLQGLDLLQSLEQLQLGSHGNERGLGLLCSRAGTCSPALRAVIALPLGKSASSSVLSKENLPGDPGY